MNGVENEITVNGIDYVRKDSIVSTAKEREGLRPVLVRSYGSGVHFGDGSGYGYGDGNEK